MEFKASVRSVVEFAYKSGSIDSGYASFNAAEEGSKAHRAIQKRRSEEEEYISELPISLSIIRSEVILTISGRIDGIIKRDSSQIIEEIKTTGREIASIEQEDNPVHLAQAKCYAYMYCIGQRIDYIGIQMTYYNRGTKESKSFISFHNFEELEEFWNEVTKKYIKWILMVNNWNSQRDISIKGLEFPFDTYRRGQRELAVAVYKSISNSKKFFVRAPTGIGKTLATIFPTVKAIGEGNAARIFYLTAKTSTRSIAEEAFQRLREKGLKFRTVTITAKEKVCQQDKISCKPEDCPYANGYFDRVDDAIEDIFQKENFTKEEILECARKNMVCPFEFSLDLSLFCDGIICDYNYVFDPRVYLKRFFMDIREDYVFLIDEAHNLVDRGREMFSSELFKSRFLSIKKHLNSEHAALKKCINEINKYFIECRKKLEEMNAENSVSIEQNLQLYELVYDFIDKADMLLSTNRNIDFKEQLMELYFDAVYFTKISELYDENYVTYIERDAQDVKYKLFCTNPSKLLARGMERGKSTVLFSATLTPLEYFKNILGGTEEDYNITISSPFDSDRLKLMISPNISTKYKARAASYSRIAEYIGIAVTKQKGNYMAFFPSYKYMDEVYNAFAYAYPEVKTILQHSEMTEEDRSNYLALYEQAYDTSFVGFAVLGGAFGEGIDLTGDRLIGAVIVGVGMPQLCLERDIIRNHFNDINGRGFEYAYIYPGMNKVLQAVGRVIRTETDRGMVLLIDDRFRTETYRQLMPQEWNNINWVRNSDDLKDEIEKFWKS